MCGTEGGGPSGEHVEDVGPHKIAHHCGLTGLLVERAAAQNKDVACQRRQPTHWEAPEGQDEDSLTPGPGDSSLQQFSGTELLGCDLLRGGLT